MSYTGLHSFPLVPRGRCHNNNSDINFKRRKWYFKARKMRPARNRRKSDRMACKQCPACEDQVPVACKYCPCGHQFPTRSKAKQKREEDKASNKEDNSTTESVAASEKSLTTDGTEISTKRRTVRTKRFRPDFFTPMDDQTPKRKSKEAADKAKRRRSRSKGSTNTAKEETPKQVPVSVPSTPDDDLFANISAEKALQYSVVLAELNRKLTSQHFVPL